MILAWAHCSGFMIFALRRLRLFSMQGILKIDTASGRIPSLCRGFNLHQALLYLMHLSCI